MSDKDRYLGDSLFVLVTSPYHLRTRSWGVQSNPSFVATLEAKRSGSSGIGNGALSRLTLRDSDHNV